MKKQLQILSILLAALFVCAISRGQGVFSLDGFAVDTLESESPFAERDAYFEAEIPASYEDFEKYRKAEAAAGQALAQHRDLLAAAEHSISQGDWETARRNIETVLQAAPDNTDLLKKASLLCALAGEYNAADRYFERYVRLKPDDVAHVAAWAAVAVRQRAWPKAEALLNRAFELSPRNLSAHFQAVVLRIATGRTKPLRNYNWHHLTLAEMYILANWMEADRQAYEKILGEKGFDQLISETLGPVPVSALSEVRLAAQRAYAAKKRNQWQPFRDILLRLQELGAQSYWVPLHLSEAHYALGSAAEALNYLQRVQQQHPQVVDAWRNAAFVRIKTGDFEGAIADARRARRLAPNDPDVEFTLISALAGARRISELWPLLEQWARGNPRRFREAMRSEDPLLQVIREDPRFGALQRSLP